MRPAKQVGLGLAAAAAMALPNAPAAAVPELGAVLPRRLNAALTKAASVNGRDVAQNSRA